MSARPTFVLIPGMDGTGELFAPLLRALDGERTRIVRYADLERDEGDAITEAVRELDDYVLVAESFGGPLAIGHASRRPRGLRALVLAASFVASPLPRALARGVPLVPGVVFDRPPPEFVVRLAMVGSAPPQDVVRSVREAIAGVSPGRIAARIRRLASLDVREEASRVDVPVLAIRPTRDRLVLAVAADALRDAFVARADARFTEVRIDAPHLVLQVAPDESARALRAFVGGLPVASQP